MGITAIENHGTKCCGTIVEGFLRVEQLSQLLGKQWGQLFYTVSQSTKQTIHESRERQIRPMGTDARLGRASPLVGLIRAI